MKTLKQAELNLINQERNTFRNMEKDIGKGVGIIGLVDQVESFNRDAKEGLFGEGYKDFRYILGVNDEEEWEDEEDEREWENEEEWSDDDEEDDDLYVDEDGINIDPDVDVYDEEDDDYEDYEEDEFIDTTDDDEIDYDDCEDDYEEESED